MKNQKGIAPILMLIALAALAAVGFGAYSVFNPFTHKRLTSEQRKDLEQAKLDNTDLANRIDAAQGARLNYEDMENVVDSVVEERRNEIAEESEKILTINPCDAYMADIEKALDLAEQAWLVADEDTGNALWEWARESFRGYVADAALAVGATFLEQDIDLMSLSYEERNELYSETRERFYDRGLLAEQAQLFGFEDIHTKILKGEFVQPVCVQLWSITTEIEYESHDHNGTYKEHWVVGATLEDIPIYKHLPGLELPKIDKQSNQKGYVKIIDMWWKEAIDTEAEYYSKQGDPSWSIRIAYDENIKDFWQDELVITAKADEFGGSEEKAYVCSDYFGCNPMIDTTLNGTLKMRVPTLRLWQRKPFSYQKSTESVDEGFAENITSKALFAPSKRVRISEL